MADINLTSGDDTYEHVVGKPFANINGLAGNDKIILHGNGWAIGGAGNDVIVNDVFDWVSGGAAYWDAPNAVFIDLEAGRE